MDVPAEELERIVRRVMERLAVQPAPMPQLTAAVGEAALPQSAATSGSAAAVSAASPAAVASAIAIPATAGSAIASVTLREKVITAQLLDERGRGARALHVDVKAVLTPSAKDWIRRQGVELVRAAPQNSAAFAAKWLALIATSTPQIAACLSQRPGGGSWTSVLSGAWFEASRQAVSALCRGEADGSVVFTDQPAAVACLANRQAAIRAASISTPAEVADSLAALGPNLFALNPKGKGQFELKAILESIAIGGPPRPPAAFPSA